MTKPLTVQKLIDNLMQIEDKSVTVYHMCDGSYWPMYEEAVNFIDDEDAQDGDLEPVPCGSVVLV